MKKPPPSQQLGKLMKTHERISPSGKKSAPDMTYGGKPLRPY